jgi:hypothetical protein
MLKIVQMAYRRIARPPPYSIIVNVGEESRSLADLVRRIDR